MNKVEKARRQLPKWRLIGDPETSCCCGGKIKHYETRVAEAATVAGKAMFVCSNRNIG